MSILRFTAAMNFLFPFFVACRYVFAGKSNRYLSFVSLSSLLGMILGVLSLLVVLSVMNGFRTDLESRVLRLVPHAHIDGDPVIFDWQSLSEKIMTYDGVKAVSPMAERNVLLRHGDRVTGATLSAIDMGSDVAIMHLRDAIYTHVIERSSNFSVLLGYSLARKLGVGPGDYITIVLPEISITAAGAFPRQKRFLVEGLYHSGSGTDANTVFTRLDTGQKVFRMNEGVSSLRLTLNDRYRASALMQLLSNELGGSYHYISWQEDYAPLFGAVRMEKNMITLMLLVIVVVASFNIISILVMMVSEKQGDIAVLRTLGATQKDIKYIFIFQGAMIGFLGVVIGGLAGWQIATHLEGILSCLNQLLHRHTSITTDIYLPSIWMWEDFFLVCSISLLLSLLASIYPAKKASLIDPANILNGA